ncbi:MAG: hypothetical protein LQ351_001493 [Letrouitia transgressa]|nr:MAG: hypothetical protein LQ351_001493 [Letrouitia transgressa]
MADPLSITASILAVLQLSSEVLRYLHEVKDAPQERVRLRDDLSSACLALSMLKERLEETEKDMSSLSSVQLLGGQDGPINRFKRLLELLSAKLMPKDGKMKTVREVSRAVAWPFKSQEVKAMLGETERQKSLFHLALQNDTTITSGGRKDYAPVRHSASWMVPLQANVDRSIAVNHTVELQTLRPKNEIGVAYVYCNYKEQDTQNAENLLASIWRQLVHDQADIGDSVRRQYKKHVGKETRPNLKEVAEELSQEIGRFQKVYVFIDALDECTDEQTRETLIDRLYEFSNLCLMVTSRYLDSIARMFENAAMLEIGAHPTDVQRYVTGRIAQGGRLSRHVKADATLGKAIEENVVKNADKMFLLAQLHMDSLVLKVSQKTIRQALDALPKGLDATYDEAMSRIDQQGEEDVRLAEQVLSWISFAVRPLKLAELREALSVEPGAREIDDSAAPDEELITSVCAGLVVIDRKSEVVRLCHYSTEEYLKRFRIIRFPTAQTDIARTCLTYLMFDEFKQGPIKDENKAFQNILNHKLLAYAATNWGRHLQGPSEQELQQMTVQFLSGVDGSMAHSIQTASWLDYFYRGYSQTYPKNVIGLHLAANFGLQTILETLLEQGADISAKDSNGENALHKAAKGGHKAVVKVLLDRGANVMAEDKSGWTALHKAATSGSDEVVILLLRSGATISSGVDGRTALHFAAEFGSEQIASALLGEGADVSATAVPDFGDTWDKKFNAGRTPLHWAASNGYHGLVRLLIDRGAKVDARNATLRTPLQEALMWGHVLVVETLLEKGASIQYADNEGWTPLHEAAWRSPARATQLLLDHGADVDALTNHPQGSVPGPYTERDEVLQGHNTPLHLAAICDDLDALKILLNKGADLYRYDQKGLTALHMAVIGRSISVIEFLLDNENCKIPVDIKDTNVGETALHKAVARGYEDCVMLLLDRGADIVAENRLEMDAKTIARSYKRNYIVELLDKYATTASLGRSAYRWTKTSSDE